MIISDLYMIDALELDALTACQQWRHPQPTRQAMKTYIVIPTDSKITLNITSDKSYLRFTPILHSS